MKAIKFLIILLTCITPTQHLNATELIANKMTLIYENCDKNSKVIEKIPEQESVEVLLREGLFWKIKYKNIIGYVFITDLSIKKQKDNLPASVHTNIQGAFTMGIRGIQSHTFSKTNFIEDQLNLLKKFNPSGKELEEFNLMLWNEFIEVMHK